MPYWTFFGESDYEKVKKFRKAAKIAALTTAVVLTGWMIAALIAGYKKDGKPEGFMQDTTTALSHWMLQNQVATFVALSTSVAANLGTLAGLGYVGFKKAQYKCAEMRESRTEQAELGSSIDERTRWFS